jgi:hypothetical protein
LIINSNGNAYGGQPGGGVLLQWSCTPIIVNNTITNNAVSGIITRSPYTSTSSVVLNNNIYGNKPYNVYLSTSADVNATYNWWGSTDTQAINQTIYDSKNDFTLGNVSFVPFLDSPNTQAPTYITASANVGGSVAPSGIININYGGSQTFTIISRHWISHT